ncbi:glutamate dehydrogenase [Brevibacterium pityocampae]
MTEVRSTEIAQQWSALTGSTPPENLLAAYYPRPEATPAERYRPRELAASAIEHARCAERHRAGEPTIEIRNPGVDSIEQIGNRTAISIVTDDMRHLVSSLVAELTGLGLAIREVHHPIIVVERGPDGMHVVAPADLSRTVTDTTALPVIAPGDSPAERRKESWIHIEVDRIPEDRFPEVEAGLRETIEFVAAVERDRHTMADTARHIAESLRTRPPRPELAEEAAESADLLDWLDGRFAFMGYREYALEESGGEKILVPIEDSALGISSLRATLSSPLSRAVAAKAEEPRVLVLTKANSRSRLIRRGYLDYVGVKTFDDTGRIVGEKRFVGLYTSGLYSASVLDIPLIASKMRYVLSHSGLARDTHSGDELVAILESYPRDDLLHADAQEILDVVTQVLDLQEKRESSVFIRRDPYERYVSVLVYVPRDLYDTAARLRVEGVLRDYYGAESVDFDVLLSDSALARLHFVARVSRDEVLPDIAGETVAERITAALRSWEEDIAEFIAPAGGSVSAADMELRRRWMRAFPPSYQEYHTPRQAVDDVDRFEELDSDAEPSVRIYRPDAEDEADVRLAFYRIAPAGLSEILPFLANLGAQVHDERPYELDLPDGEHRYVYDFGLSFDRPLDDGDFARIERAFTTAWTGERESGRMDSLVASGLEWQDVSIIRAFTHYLRQAGFSLTERHMGEVFTTHVALTTALVELFRVRFDPDLDESRGTREELMRAREEEIEAALAEVASLDADRVLRAVLELIRATVRTNVFQPADGRMPAATVFKILPTRLDFVPKPKPALEMWVYSPEVEGVHLRFGPVARGGLRWSDRADDFRTEVLGLVKAQMVKNALIVPTGAKGGFFPKQLPDPAVDRDDWAAAGQHAYELFIGALLDVADNLVTEGEGTRTVRPERTVVHDGEDSYLVVAADKGTARFSDVANRIALERGFWLGDAFASGGSVGYDHKAMGITSRGAWTSVERHFRELGLDTSRDEFTAVGIGDMSGDVFGNGMLRSDRTRLVAAFDHRDVFLDPDPDAAASYTERRRLFETPRSSWQDYDPELISAGGGVYPRSAKTIEVSERAAERLGMRPGAHPPTEVIRAILRAPVDLLYNGGIGTYVKAETESHLDVGDKANDAIRVDGGELRARVVGEGGNLGFTQLGRVEAALGGVRLNTDAVDNSAGVDCSDHEVNIKLLLDLLIRRGEFAAAERESVLLSMTDEVAGLVLANNYSQNVALGEARDRAQSMTSTQRRLLKRLEKTAELDRAVEFLPDDKALNRRAEAGRGFTSPELAVLLAYVKMDTAGEILSGDLPAEDWTREHLVDYFPDSLAQRHADAFVHHPLHREIATAHLVNRIVDRGGLTYIFRMQEETGASVAQVARAFTVVSRVFDLDAHFEDICALDNRVPAEVQVQLLHGYVRLLDRASRWLVHQAPDGLDVLAEVDRYRPVIRELRPLVPGLLRGQDRAELEDAAHRWIGEGVPEELAFRAAALLDEFALLDVAQAASRTDTPAIDAAEVYYAVTDLLAGSQLLNLIGDLDRRSRWTALARGAMRDDFYQAVLSIVVAILTVTDSERATPAERADDRIAQWRVRTDASLRQVLSTIDEVIALEQVDQAPLSVLLRMMRSVVRSTEWGMQDT